MLPCTSTEMDDVLMSASTLWWRKFDQDLKIQDPVVGAKNLGLAYGRLSKINILADKPIPAERSELPPGGRDGFIGQDS